ncbi:hypothetical protein VTP01DRAFT_8752 [Rhizomucor pusillus]|uniref:uncharacterized protein n=1 Tax=Rhizomucor pusillus TaxID=4840 RepID=UPI003742193C
MLRHVKLRPNCFRPLQTWRCSRYFSITAQCCNEEKKKNIRNFPWRLHSDPPRIPEYPWKTPFEYVPKWIQQKMSRELAFQFGRVAAGGPPEYPENFLKGATMATRRALAILSQHLSNPHQEETRQQLERIFQASLLEKLTRSAADAFEDGVKVDIELPQIYDAIDSEVWLLAGNPQALTNPDLYETWEWFAVTLNIKAPATIGKDESMSDYYSRIYSNWLEGVQVKIDVNIDADVVYTVRKGEEILLRDEGRRELRMQFATPYFAPMRKMLPKRDPETLELIQEWQWTVADIDQLVEKDRLEKPANEES